MTSGHVTPQAETQESPPLRLEIADQETTTPRLIPVLIRNLSSGGVTLTVTNPRDIPNWDRYHGADCVLQVDKPGRGGSFDIRAKIAWTRTGGAGQPPLSLGLQLIKPPVEAISRLSNLLPQTSQDIKQLWERYDQVKRSPKKLNWVYPCYIAGLVLLLAGLVLQFVGPHAYKGWGWVLWVLGTLGIAGKIIRPFRQIQPSSDRIGKSF